MKKLFKILLYIILIVFIGASLGITALLAFIAYCLFNYKLAIILGTLVVSCVIMLIYALISYLTNRF